MVKVIAKNFVKEDKVDKFLELSKELVKETLKEKGCISYGMYQDEKEATTLIMVEEWKTMEDLDRHLASEHFERIFPKMSEYMTKEGELNICKKII